MGKGEAGRMTTAHSVAPSRARGSSWGRKGAIVAMAGALAIAVVALLGARWGEEAGMRGEEGRTELFEWETVRNILV